MKRRAIKIIRTLDTRAAAATKTTTNTDTDTDAHASQDTRARSAAAVGRCLGHAPGAPAACACATHRRDGRPSSTPPSRPSRGHAWRALARAHAHCVLALPSLILVCTHARPSPQSEGAARGAGRRIGRPAGRACRTRACRSVCVALWDLRRHCCRDVREYLERRRRGATQRASASVAFVHCLGRRPAACRAPPGARAPLFAARALAHAPFAPGSCARAALLRLPALPCQLSCGPPAAGSRRTARRGAGSARACPFSAAPAHL